MLRAANDASGGRRARSDGVLRRDRAAAPIRRTEKPSMRILIADDHELFREGLKVVLNALGDDVTLLECGGLDAAVEIAAGGDGLDLAILDFDMPGMNRATGVAEFCARFPKTPVVVLAGMVQRVDVVASLLRGASGFVPKALGKDAMVSAFRLVLAGEM